MFIGTVNRRILFLTCIIASWLAGSCRRSSIPGFDGLGFLLGFTEPFVNGIQFIFCIFQ